ncbi:hypothetical protein GWI33_013326 [Rhynchophorus ferrugineus]|uniref:Uncharacterized protein n=1 Tax=Rhynchophorus ferrugineus TaxID=354439 RepID=A0A834M7Z3_RHYFE|nr:hypothetical protein GWI33_013326 [Rhynchophorus ferrugineus]
MHGKAEPWKASPGNRENCHIPYGHRDRDTLVCAAIARDRARRRPGGPCGGPRCIDPTTSPPALVPAVSDRLTRRPGAYWSGPALETAAATAAAAAATEAPTSPMHLRTPRCYLIDGRVALTHFVHPKKGQGRGKIAVSPRVASVGPVHGKKANVHGENER